MKQNVLILKIEGIKENAVKAQEVLTQYGCLIQARLGIHESSGMICSNSGLVILILQNNPDEIKAFQEALNNTTGVKAILVTI
ncbi:hypothetical protein LLG10_02860 [bacterium]|nr:hypothetical protein [bacterium]